MLNALYSHKKKKQRRDLANMVEKLNDAALSIEDYHKHNHRLLREEDEEMKQMQSENSKKNKVMQFID